MHLSAPAKLLRQAKTDTDRHCAQYTFKPKFHLARQVLSQHHSTRSKCRACRDERVELCCSNMADDEQAIVLTCTSLVVLMLLHTQALFAPSKYVTDKLMYTPIN